MIIETKINLNNKTKNELIMLLNESSQVIQKYENELEKKDKQISLMAEKLVEDKEWYYSEFDNYTKQDFIEYFSKKVDEENERRRKENT